MDREHSCWAARRGLSTCEGDCHLLLQLDDLRQCSDHDCGDAAVAVVLAFHRITAAVRLSTPQHGTDPTQIESGLRRMGLYVTAGEMSVADLQHYCDSRRPVIALVGCEGGSDSHYVCVRGVSRGTVYFHDVMRGPQKVKASEWEATWHAAGRVGEFRRWGIVAWPG